MKTNTPHDTSSGFSSILPPPAVRQRASRVARQLRLPLTIILLVAPAALTLFYIAAYGVNTLYSDQWDFLHLVEKLHQGSLSAADLFAQKGEHRNPVPVLFMLALGYVSRYNTVYELYSSWLLVLLGSAFVFLAYVRAFGSSSGALLRFAPIIWLLFTWRQSENFLAGWQLVLFMGSTFFLAAVYFLYTSEKVGWRFLFAILCGLISTFSFANGLLVWPLGACQLLWFRAISDHDARRTNAKQIVIWGAVAAGAILAYFSGFHSLSDLHPAYASGFKNPSPFYPLQHPVAALVYGLVALGAPLSSESFSAFGFGLVLLILYTVAIGVALLERAWAYREMMVPAVLIAFSLGSLGLLVIGRSEFGADHALTSRYTTTQIPGLIGLYMFVSSGRLVPQRARWFLFSSVLTVIVLGLIIGWTQGWREGVSTHEIRSRMRYALQTHRLQTDATLKDNYFNPQMIRDRIWILEKYRLNVFSDPQVEPQKLEALTMQTAWSIDLINGLPAQGPSPVILACEDGGSFRIEGWAIDTRAQGPVGGVFINVDGRTDLPARYALDRPDIARHFRDERYRRAGFAVSLGCNALPKGLHQLSPVIITSDRRARYKAEKSFVVEVR